MMHDIHAHWPDILQVVQQAKKSSRFFSMATVDTQGNPYVTPIGHVFFREDGTAYYFDAYSQHMPQHFQHNRRVCVMAVNSGAGFWLKSLFKARFNTAPAVRLFGEVGDKRPATGAEKAQLAASIKATSRLKGHQLLWANLDQVRDIRFDEFRYASYPVMCEGFR